jgi:hypothetical protein
VTRRPAITRATAAAVLSAALLCATSAGAGTIGFRTDAEVRSNPGIDTKVSLTHTGDETASAVMVRAELLDRTIDGETVPSLGPGQSRDWNFHLFDTIRPGVYVVVLRTRYSDGNGYPFEVVSTATAPVGADAAPKIYGSLVVPRLEVDGSVEAKLTAKRPPQRRGSAKVRIVVPSGLDVDPKEAVLEFDETGRALATFQVRNLKLLAGTSVNIFGLVSSDDAGFPQTDTIRGSVSIGAKPVRVRAPMFYQAAAAAFALLLLLEAGAFVLARRRAQG